jgi:hypothetical protein
VKFIIAIVLLFAIAVVVMLLRAPGPRITTIERRDDADDRTKGDGR